MKNYITFIFVAVVLTFSFCAYAANGHIQKKHHIDAGVSCMDCHATETPVKAADSKACKSCHGDIRVEGKKVKFQEKRTGRIVEVNPHASHAGPINCTQCHSEHKTSKLLCNTGCHGHHTWSLQVP